MNYYELGSIEKFNWNHTNTDILKNILKVRENINHEMIRHEQLMKFI